MSTESDHGRIRMGGGFNGDSIYSRMSAQALVTVRESLWWDEQRARRDEQERAERVAAFEEASIRASVRAAAMRGEHVDPRTAARGVGRTHREVLQEASDRMDLEDRRQAYRRSREGANLTDLEWSDLHSADTSAPDIHSDEGKAEQARLAAQLERGRELRAQKRRATRIAKAVVRLNEKGWL